MGLCGRLRVWFRRTKHKKEVCEPDSNSQLMTELREELEIHLMRLNSEELMKLVRMSRKLGWGVIGYRLPITVTAFRRKVRFEVMVPAGDY